MKPMRLRIRPDGYRHISDLEFKVHRVLWSLIWVGVIGLFIWAGVNR